MQDVPQNKLPVNIGGFAGKMKTDNFFCRSPARQIGPTGRRTIFAGIFLPTAIREPSRHRVYRVIPGAKAPQHLKPNPPGFYNILFFSAFFHFFLSFLFRFFFRVFPP